MPRAIHYVDVFGEIAYSGNPVAVVLDADGLSPEEMQVFARWTNLSETTFVVPPTTAGADYRVRIFTPSTELPFAGHPTLGTCHAWLATNGTTHRGDAVVQECGAGLVTVRREERLAFAAPPLLRSGAVSDELLGRAISGLGLGQEDIVDAAWVDNGPGWMGLLLKDADAVLAVEPGSLGDLFVGVVGLHPDGTPEVRAFFPAGETTGEDPVTGSLNASLAQWLLETGVLSTPYVARQGTAIGRRGRIHVTRDADGTIWVGGLTRTCITGEVEL